MCTVYRAMALPGWEYTNKCDYLMEYGHLATAAENIGKLKSKWRDEWCSKERMSSFSMVLDFAPYGELKTIVDVDTHHAMKLFYLEGQVGRMSGLMEALETWEPSEDWRRLRFRGEWDW